MHLGLEKNEAARFSFLLSLPAIAGATMLKTLEIFDQNMTVTEWQTIGIGFLFSFVAGYASIRFLLSVIRRGKFSYFAIYCFLLGVAGLLYFA
jgi:undecaprenyl-diphosphatase